MTTEHYDVIIIGTGADGGTLAHKLAPSGKRILLLERGGYLPREPETGTAESSLSTIATCPARFWYDKDGDAFRPHQQHRRQCALAREAGDAGGNGQVTPGPGNLLDDRPHSFYCRAWWLRRRPFGFKIVIFPTGLGWSGPGRCDGGWIGRRPVGGDCRVRAERPWPAWFGSCQFRAGALDGPAGGRRG